MVLITNFAFLVSLRFPKLWPTASCTWVRSLLIKSYVISIYFGAVEIQSKISYFIWKHIFKYVSCHIKWEISSYKSFKVIVCVRLLYTNRKCITFNVVLIGYNSMILHSFHQRLKNYNKKYKYYILAFLQQTYDSKTVYLYFNC